MGLSATSTVSPAIAMGRLVLGRGEESEVVVVNEVVDVFQAGGEVVHLKMGDGRLPLGARHPYELEVLSLNSLDVDRSGLTPAVGASFPHRPSFARFQTRAAGGPRPGACGQGAPGALAAG
jgi:hypothetical protein